MSRNAKLGIKSNWSRWATVLCTVAVIALFVGWASFPSLAAADPVLYDVHTYGARGDGVSDDTAAINSAINAASAAGGGTVLVPAGTYLIDPVQSVRMKSGVSLQVDGVLQGKTNGTAWTALILAKQVSNVTISGGGTLIGDRATHTGDGEYGHGVAIINSSNVSLRGLTITDCFGDGIYISWHWGDSHLGNNQNVTVEGVTTDRTRRNGLTINGLIGGMVRNSAFLDSAGTSPEAGIGFEPDAGYATPHNSDITIEDCQTQSSGYQGLYIYHWQNDHITLRRVTSLNDTRYGFVLDGDYLTVEDCSSSGASGAGLVLRGNHIRVSGGSYSTLSAASGSWTEKPTVTDIIVNTTVAGRSYSKEWSPESGIITTTTTAAPTTTTTRPVTTTTTARPVTTTTTARPVTTTTTAAPPTTTTTAAPPTTTTTTPPPRTTGPVVSITSPLAGSTMTRYVTIKATATATAGIYHVEFWLDGVRKSYDRSKPYSTTWKTTTWASGYHGIKVVAYDKVGNHVESTILVAVGRLSTFGF